MEYVLTSFLLFKSGSRNAQSLCFLKVQGLWLNSSLKDAGFGVDVRSEGACT